MKLNTITITLATVMLSQQALALEFHGYMRAGFGLNANGGSQVCYGDGGPNSHVVGRLGDECDTYAELSLSQNVVERDNGAKFSIHTLVAYGTNEGNVDNRGNSWQGVGEQNDPWSGQRLSFREAYAKYAMADEKELWVGNRYYGRKDVHINDWYYVNGSGYGLGLDNVKVGNGALAFAMRVPKWKDVGYTFDGSEYVPADDNQAYTATPILDVRWNGIDVGNGSLDAILMVGAASLSNYQKDAADALVGDYNNKTAINGTLEWTTGHSAGFNKLIGQYSTEGMAWSGYGMNNHLGDSVNIGGFDETTGEIGDNQIGRSSWRIIDHGVYNFSNQWEIGYSAFYSGLSTDSGSGKRYGATVRPRYLWDDSMATVIEAGYYAHEDPWEDSTSDLGKITLAQTWSPLAENGGFWARPELRIFVTNYLGDDAKTNNKTFVGAQVEAWW